MKHKRKVKLCLSFMIAMLTLFIGSQTLAQNITSDWIISLEVINPASCMFEGPARVHEIQPQTPTGLQLEMELFLKSGAPGCQDKVFAISSSPCFINPDYSINNGLISCQVVMTTPWGSYQPVWISGHLTPDLTSATGAIDYPPGDPPYDDVDGTWTAKRSGDAILFPWIVQSDDVTTIVSVVNTAQTWAESQGLPFHNNSIHVEYWAKKSTANDQEEMCEEYNFEVTSSKDDMVTWDIGGHFNGGLPMFNDTSNTIVNNAVPDFTLAVEKPRRGFLIVDNATEALLDARTPVDGTMYGEATIIEHKTGATWGYVAYNGMGGLPYFYDTLDEHGEVIGGITVIKPMVFPPETFSLQEITQTTLLNPNDAITKLFVTPIGLNQRKGNINSRVQLCRLPEKFSGYTVPYGTPSQDIEVSSYYGIHQTGNCISGGIWNNEEGGFSFTVEKNIVCTTADNIVDFFGGAGTSAYTQWVASGKAGWAYIITPKGNLDEISGTENYFEADAAAIGKLEFGTGLNWDGGIADTINTFVWLRDQASADYKILLDPSLLDPIRHAVPGGIDIIHNENYKSFELTELQAFGACCPENDDCIESQVQDICESFYSGTWYEGLLCSEFTCPPPPTGACCNVPFVDCIPNLTEAECAEVIGGGSIWFEGADCSACSG